ncbi:hypothetical protein AAG570_004143 [Ranatra chinensis]|uniref:Uncharacterized protein n=1 Tax=Ranatra chinensis TaxID=642074 RepID=A0ABD0YFH0_9HEMI
MSTRYDALEERIIGLEDKLANIQEQVELLPELLTRCLQQAQQQSSGGGSGGGGLLGPPLPPLPAPQLAHSRSVPPPPPSSSPYHWPASPILPPISSRTPHLVPEPLQPNS